MKKPTQVQIAIDWCREHYQMEIQYPPSIGPNA